MTTLIIGGGLSGLALADMLHARGDDFTLIEARSRLGGRILSLDHGGAGFDLGPAWFWPGQPRIAELLDRLELEVFEQYATGALSFEDTQGPVQRGRGHASMQGALRVAGGMGAVIDALAQTLPTDKIRLGAQVTGLSQTQDCVTATLSDGTHITGTRAVLALPPRLMATLAFTPALPAGAMAAMQSVPTWMAGQAKAVAMYDNPFWRTAGLSGDAMSRRGPMVEIHDASPARGGPYALFGFIGVPPKARADQTALADAIRAQLVRLFGYEAGTPTALHIMDWAAQAHTATPADYAPLTAHPAYGLPGALRDLWQGRLICAGTETAATFGGFIEGALEAAEAARHTLYATPD